MSYSSLTKGKLIDALRKRGVSESEISKFKTRYDMIDALGRLDETAENVEVEIQDTPVSPKIDDEELSTAPVETEPAPFETSSTDTKDVRGIVDTEDMNIHNPGWTQYVLSHLREDELVDGYPKCDGLRRVFNLLIGDIIWTRVWVSQCPTVERPWTATVQCEIGYRRRLDENNYESYERTVSDASDVNEANTKEPFCYHPVATASTCAEARTLRKAMHLNVLAGEEMTMQPESEDMSRNISTAENNSGIKENQEKAVSSLCKRIGIHVDAFLKKEFSDGNIVSDNLKNVSYSNAQYLIKTLNHYDKDNSNIPEEIISDSN